MTRGILPPADGNSSDSSAQAGESPRTAGGSVTPSSAAATAERASPRDALAQAFPPWDLLPAVPLIRRVK